MIVSPDLPHASHCGARAALAALPSFKHSVGTRNDGHRTHGAAPASNSRVWPACQRHRRRQPLRGGAEAETGRAASPDYCVIIECDGVLVDVHIDGHRRAFNAAFEALGYACVNWTAPIYYDLLRLGDGTGPGLIRTYYELMGWPLMLSTPDRPVFVANVYAAKNRILKEMAASGEVPLRQGVAQFIDELLADGVRPVVIAGTASRAEDSVVSSAMYNLGPNRAFQLQVLTLGATAEASGSSDADGGGDPQPPSLARQVSDAQNNAKSSLATDFARAINLQNVGAGMRVDPALLAARERAWLVSPQYVAALVAVMGCQAPRSALVAANHSLMEAAKGAGVLTAGVPPSLAARGGYSAMDAHFDGFGAGGGLTWRKLKGMLDARAAGPAAE